MYHESNDIHTHLTPNSSTDYTSTVCFWKSKNHKVYNENKWLHEFIDPGLLVGSKPLQKWSL